MPLRWTILDDQKLIHVVAEGPVTLREMEAHFDDLMVKNVFSYAKLFDATRLEPVYSERDMFDMAARLSAYSKLESGPLAVVAVKDDVITATERFFNMSMSPRAAGRFSTEKKARAWLAERHAPLG